MNKFWDNYPDIQNKLELVKSHMIKVSKNGNEFFNSSFDYLFSNCGKMLRPAFIIIGSMLKNIYLNEEKQNLINNLASAIEMLHNATLIHDDIIDDSFLRRGKQSIQSKFSKEYAVYMGDFLFSECFLMLSKFDIPKEIMIKLAEGISSVCKAEMSQNYYRYNLNITDEQYLKIISGKTASIFGLSLGLGASQLDFNEKDIQKIYNIGFNIGMAFQITDDILDYTSKESVIGKDVKSDILKGYYTLPIILSFNTTYKNEIKRYLEKENLDNTDLNKIYSMIQDSNVLKKSELIAEEYTNKSISLLNNFDESDGKKILLEIIPFLLKRVY